MCLYAGSEKLSKGVAEQKWDRVKVVCTQPYNKVSSLLWCSEHVSTSITSLTALLLHHLSHSLLSLPLLLPLPLSLNNFLLLSFLSLLLSLSLHAHFPHQHPPTVLTLSHLSRHLDHLDHPHHCHCSSLPHTLTPSHPHTSTMVPIRRSSMACHSSLFALLLKTPLATRKRRPHPPKLLWVHSH